MIVSPTEPPKVLVVDDDALVRRALEASLRRHYRVLGADGGEQALALLGEHADVAVAVIDQRMPGMSGPELIRRMSGPHPNVVRIILTGYQDIESLKQAINNGGAWRYLEKPCANEELLEAVGSAAQLHARLVEAERLPAALSATTRELAAKCRQLEVENVQLRLETERDYTLDGQIVGSSAALRKVLAEADRMATTDSAVLILGETGSGKELLARRIHARSARRAATFRAQNCGAVPEQLMEDTLFGHVAGAFTGARQAKKGLFEIADGGTLFLDEIGECSAGLQTRLLRVIEEKIVHRLGDDEHDVAVDVRLVTATNRDLAAEVEAGTFRRDLYYRLAVFCLRMPPLRERRSDIRELATYFLAGFNERARRLSGKVVGGFDAAALAVLEQQDFPGNVRELANVVERAWLFADDGGMIGREHIQAEAAGSVAPPVPPDVVADDAEAPLREAVWGFKAAHITRVLTRHDWNIAAAARALGISRGRLYEAMRECGVQRPPH